MSVFCVLNVFLPKGERDVHAKRLWEGKEGLLASAWAHWGQQAQTHWHNNQAGAFYNDPF
jgi:hypothetical protein